MKEASEEGIWIARVELRPSEGTPEFVEGIRGGFVTVLVRCSSDRDFREQAKAHLSDEGFEVVRIEGLAPLLKSDFEANALIHDLAERTSEYPVQWSTFQLYRDTST